MLREDEARSSLLVPSVEEVKAASDAITKDGENAPLTLQLSMLTMVSPILRASSKHKVNLIQFLLSQNRNLGKLRRGDELASLLSELPEGDDTILMGIVSSAAHLSYPRPGEDRGSGQKRKGYSNGIVLRETYRQAFRLLD